MDEEITRVERGKQPEAKESLPPREEEVTPENAKGVMNKLKKAGSGLMERGRAKLRWLGEKFGLSKQEEDIVGKQLEDVNEEIEENLEKAEEELNEVDSMESSDDKGTAVAREEGTAVASKRGLEKSGSGLERVLSSDIIGLPGNLKSIEADYGDTEAEQDKVNEQIYSSILNTFIERANGSNLKGESLSAEEVDNIKIQIESDEEALEKLNAMDSKDEEDKKQIAALKKEIEDHRTRLDQGGESRDLKREKEKMKEALSYLQREGNNPIESLSRMIGTLYTKRNQLEIELNPRTETEKTNIEEDIRVLEDIRDNGMPKNRFDKPNEYTGKYGENEIIELVDSEENAANILKDSSERRELSAKEKEAIQEVIDNRKKLLEDPPEGKEREELQKKVDNLTGILKIVGEKQKEVKRGMRLDNIRRDQKKKAELAKKLNIGSSEMAPVLKLREKQYKSFRKKIESSNVDVEEAYDRFIEGILEEVRSKQEPRKKQAA